MTQHSEYRLFSDEEAMAVARETPVGFHVNPVLSNKFCPGGQQKPNRVLFMNQSITGKCETRPAFFVFNPLFVERAAQGDE